MRRLWGRAPVMQGEALGPRREASWAVQSGCRGALSAVGEPAQAWPKTEPDGGTAAEEPHDASWMWMGDHDECPLHPVESCGVVLDQLGQNPA